MCAGVKNLAPASGDCGVEEVDVRSDGREAHSGRAECFAHSNVLAAYAVNASVDRAAR